MSIKIIGTGSYAPAKTLTNDDLAKFVDTNDEWITTRTGIKMRHIASDDEKNSDMALQASLRALENAGITADQLDFISVATVSGDSILPSTSCIIQGKLGNLKCACYDVLAACSGFLYSLQLGLGFLKGRKKYRYGLVVGVEKLSALTDWTDRNTCVLFGDGASAAVIAKDDSDDSDFILGGCFGADGKQTSILCIPAGGTLIPASHDTVDNKLHFIRMDGREVYKYAVPAMTKAAKEALDDAELTAEDIRWVIPHQANKRIIDAVAARLGLSEEKVFSNIDRYANTSAASIGICLDELARSGRLVKGDKVLLTAFGAGLTWAALVVEW